MTSTLGLCFIKHQKKGLPFSPRAYIYVKLSTDDDKGRKCLTPQDCISISELESQIDILHKELEIIKKEAKRKW